MPMRFTQVIKKFWGAWADVLVFFLLEAMVGVKWRVKRRVVVISPAILACFSNLVVENLENRTTNVN